MVGVVVGLLVMLAIVEVFAFWEAQKRTTSAGSDAQSNGVAALYFIERDARLAGYGFNTLQMLGCTVRASFKEEKLPVDLSLAPITITNGAGFASDSIRIVASNTSGFSVPTTVIKDHPPSANNFCVNSNLGLKGGDFVIAFDPNEPSRGCTMAQVTAVPHSDKDPKFDKDHADCSTQVQHSSAESEWNPPAGKTSDGTSIYPSKPEFNPEGYPTNSLLYNIGALIDRTYFVDANNEMKVSELSMVTGAAGTFTLVPQVVSLQAEYGKDTDNNGQVDTWDNVTPTTSDEWAQVLAVRVAVVTRSQNAEKTDVTDDEFVNKNAPEWAKGLIDLSKNADGGDSLEWKRYRYKIFSTVIPLRNLIWQPELMSKK
jgi:type IV pilus assembly protein PilW